MNSSFFETFSLYKKLALGTDFDPKSKNLDQFTLTMDCKNCNSKQTFTQITCERLYDGEITSVRVGSSQFTGLHNEIRLIKFRCAKCNNFHRFFIIYFDDSLDYVMKIGQYPPWDISISKEMKEVLEKTDLKYFKNGLICESQGYGIGAFAYYRRIVENSIEKLLKLIPNLMTGDEKAKFENALVQVEKTRVTEQKIELVKDLLPPTLRPNSYNPLKILHSQLSIGLHSSSEEECLEIALQIRSVLEFFIKRLLQTRKENQEFTENMKKLLKKRIS